jgi:hypothetical protein
MSMSSHRGLRTSRTGTDGTAGAGRSTYPFPGTELYNRSGRTMTIRRSAVVAFASVVFAACGSPDREGTGPEAGRETPGGPGSPAAAMDTAHAHAAHGADADLHAGHAGMEHGAMDHGARGPGDAHAAHGAAAADGVTAPGHHAQDAHTPAAGHDEHAGHAPAPGRAAAGHDVHAEHDQHATAAPGERQVAAHGGHGGHAADAGHVAHPADPHAGHTAAAGAGAAGAAAPRLSSLVEALLAEPAVQERIREDPELREMWGDPGVRHHVTMVPEMVAGMASLLELVRVLAEDPAVQRRILAEPALRDLWSEPGVRERIQPEALP